MSNNLPAKSSFQLMDEADEQQIIADSEVQKSLVYIAQGKKTLSYTGIKFLFQKWTQEKQLTVEILKEHSYCNLERDDPENKNFWYWRAQFTLRTTRILEDGKTQVIETQGQSESPYIFNGQYDQFGRTKAFSKAERNADRKQIPEFEITHMINGMAPENIQQLNGNANNTSNAQHTKPSPVAAHYLDTLKDLGYTGIPPKTSFEACKIIEKLKQDTETVSDDDYEKYCICEKSIPDSVYGKTCITCKKLLKENKK